MKKIFLSVLVLFLMFTPMLLLGIEYQDIPGGKGFDKDKLIEGLMDIATLIFTVLLVVGVIGIVIAGYFFVTSAGDAGKIKTARDTLIYSLVGVLVGALSLGLINLVVGWFGISVTTP